MLIQNPISREEFRKSINYGFYYPLSNEQEQKRQEILADYNRRLTHLRPQLTKRPDLEQSLELGFSNWRLFTGIVSKVKHITQLDGEDDYCVLAYDEKTKYLYIAKEIFSGQISEEDLSVFLLSQLTGRSLSSNELGRLFSTDYQRQAEFTQRFLKSRVVPYQLAELIEVLLDGITDEKTHELNNQTLSPQRVKIHEQKIHEALADLITRKPRNIKDFINHVEKLISKRELFNMYDLTDKLGELGILNTKMHILLRNMRMNLVEGDLKELQYNYLDSSIIFKYLSADGEFLDVWIDSEIREFVDDYQEFLAQTREHIIQSSQEYDSAIKTGDIKQAKQLKDNLINMRKDFPFSIDQDTINLIQELDSAIKRMNMQTNQI